MTELVLDEADLRDASLLSTVPLILSSGQVLVEIVKNAFTANVISYATAGKSLRYYDFFPTIPNKASVPSWGIGVVVASRDERIKIGERLYGFFPFRQYVTLTVSQVRGDAFLDLAEHRADLSQVYNTYSRLSSGKDPFYLPEFEDHMIVLKPLFLTSWLLANYATQRLKDKRKKQVIVTSASSKTSYALAYLLKHCFKLADMSITGLTSERNFDFVKSLNVFDRIITYDKVTSLTVEGEKETTTEVIDMAGNGKTLERINDKIPHANFSLVGATDWKNTGVAIGKFFFAPKHAVAAVKNLGGEENFNAALSKDWVSFISHVKASNWCEIKYKNGPQEVLQTYKTALDSSGVDPREGVCLSMWPQNSRL